MSQSRPLVAVPACRKPVAGHSFHMAGEKYLEAVIDGAGAMPVVIPAAGDRLGLGDLLGRVDGLLMTGSHSNVEPHHYGGDPSAPDTLHDPARDSTVLPLLPMVFDAGLPVFAICRGCQEMNVAFGGTLHQRVHEQPGMLDHREDPEAPFEVQYGPAHEVHLAAGGILRELAGAESVMVNSLHGQGIEHLAEGMLIEATAPDGLVEAFRPRRAHAFAMAVQWHPEWQFGENPFSTAMFEAFGEATRQYAAGR